MESDYKEKFKEYVDNEKVLKQNIEILQKYTEELEKERANERTLR